MTSAQRIKLMSTWWPAACDAQGWDPADRVKRMEVLSDAVGRVIRSANELNNTGDIDAVKAHIGTLAHHLNSALEAGNPNAGQARRFRFKIRQHLKTLTRIWGAQKTQGILAELLRDMFQGGARSGLDKLIKPLTLDDLTADPAADGGPSQLERLLMNLAAKATQAKDEPVGVIGGPQGPSACLVEVEDPF